MNLTELFMERVTLSPRQIALISSGAWKTRSLSFADLEAASANAAQSLQRCGLGKGDKILLLLPVSIELYVALLAIFRLGLVALFPSPSGGMKGVGSCCRRVKPKGFIGTAGTLSLQVLSTELWRIPLKFSCGLPFPGATSLSMAAKKQSALSLVDCDHDHPALITFTTGSSGVAKATVRSHGVLIAQYQALVDATQLKAGEIDLATLPVFVLANLAAGVTTLIADTDLRHPGKINAKAVLKQIESFCPARATASPAFFSGLAKACMGKNVRLPSLNKIYTGGAPVFTDIIDQLTTLAPAADIVCLYGSTEAEPIALVRYAQLTPNDKAAIGSGAGLPAGYPVPQIDLRILPDRWGQPIGPFSAESFARESLPANASGEIVVAGDHVLQGYLDGLGDEESKFAVAGRIWHRTGDAGYLDEQGRLWLVGKCVARICDDRGELYPLTVEAACRSFTEIRNVAMVSHRGRRLLLLESDTDPQADLAAIRKKLDWACVDAVRTVPMIPLDSRHNAKIDYQALFKLLSKLNFDGA